MLLSYAGSSGDSFKRRIRCPQPWLGPQKQFASLDSRNRGSSLPSGYKRSKRRWQPTIGYKLTLVTLPSQPRPPANKRPRVPNHAAVYGSGDVMGTGFISTIHSHRPHCTGLRWKKVDSPPTGGTQIINRNLVRLLRKNPATVTGEAEWLSLGIARPQIDSFVRSSAEDRTFYCPVPEDARETRFLCTINAPTHLRLKALVEMWDLGRYNTLRDELIKGRDLIVMPSEWWPNVPCPRPEALPGELDLEGWDSDDDRDNRGPETCLSPFPVPERKKMPT